MLKPLIYTAVMLPVLLLTSFTTTRKVAASSSNVLKMVPVKVESTIPQNTPSVADNLYEQGNLAKAGLSKTAFELAYKGYSYLKETKKMVRREVMAVIDFSKASSEKRLFIINLHTGRLLLKSLVAHGQNSGMQYATHFSNDNESHQSSLGFYIGLDTYDGEHGYSLKLKGCEQGINDAAYDRAIVIHPADYVSDEVVRSRGTIGRSFGCPAVPEKLHKKIIDLLKNGSCLFIYHPTTTYLKQSQILNG